MIRRGKNLNKGKWSKRIHHKYGFKRITPRKKYGRAARYGKRLNK